MATKTFKIGLSATDKQNMAQDIYELVVNMCFDEYDSANTYNQGDFVVYENPTNTFKLYKCIANNVTGAWDNTKWELAKLQDILDDIENAVQYVNDKANVDGNYPTMTVGVADQLSPYDEDSGDDQDEPFSFQATGTANGTQSDFSTGSIALMKEKQGNTIVVNQKIDNSSTSTGTGPRSWFSFFVGGQTISINNGEVTVSSSSESTLEVGQTAEFPINHYILLMIKAKINSGDNVSLQIRCARGNSTLNYNSFGLAETTYKTYYKIIQDTTNSLSYIGCGCNNTEEHDRTLTIKDFFAIDLTQMFNGNIPSDLLSHPENFFRYYQGSLAYNTGTLVNANAQYIKCIGRNQCDEVFEGNGIDGNGDDDTSPGSFRTKNYQKVNPGLTYHLHSKSDLGVSSYIVAEYDKDKNFVKYTEKYTNNQTYQLSSNTCYVRLTFWKSGSGWASNVPSKETAQIVFSIYYEGESVYDQYYPYEVLTNNDTGTETLLSAGSVKDSKLPSGEIIRRIGSVDLGILSWSHVEDSGKHYFYATLSDMKYAPDYYQKPNAICDKYQVLPQAETDANPNSLFLTYQSTKQVWVVLTTNTSPTGTLFYELETPTPKQGTLFSENLLIDDFGSMDFQGTNGVPQGNLIFYPVDYKAFIDTLYKYTEGTPSKLALKSDLASDKSELQGVDTQLQNAVGGTLRHMLASSQSIDFDDIDFVDLGSLTWEKRENENYWCAQLPSAMPSSSSQNCICTKYKTVTTPYGTDNKAVSTAQNHYVGEVNIYDSDLASYTSAQVKALLKGVLFAYEKASS